MPTSADDTPRIFRYVVRIDRGGSPNPDHGWCSLAVCKPQIRRTARVGDWIVGLRSRVNDEVIYAMRVDEVLGLNAYWRDLRFKAKRPGRTPTPDNFYRADRTGVLTRVENDLHGADDSARDTAGLHALVSWHFWYFGANSPPLPNHLIHLVHSGQGHALHTRRRPGDIDHLTQWLSHWPAGVLGDPVDRPSYRRVASKTIPQSTRLAPPDGPGR